MAKQAFVYTTNQDNLRRINSRLQGLRIELTNDESNIEGRKAEITRMQMAYDDVRSRMSQEEFDAMVAHETHVLTPAEKAAEAKANLARMAENKDRVSI
jgi:hypothetical protein